LGVIDTLSAGFGLINRRLWLILLPIALDLFLWYGPRLSIAPVARDTLRALYPDPAQPPPPSAFRPPEEATPAQREQMSQMLDGLGRSNLFALLSGQFAQVPTLSGTLEWLDLVRTEDSFVRATEDRGGELEIGHFPALMGLSFLLTPAFLLAGSLYYLTLAVATQGPEGRLRFGPAGFAGQVFLGWFRLIGYFVLLGLGLALLLAPTLVAVAALALVSLELAGLVLSFVGPALVAWPMLFLFFVVPAMFTGDVGPLRGIRYSFKVVQLNFGPAMRLIAVTYVLSLGLPMAWRLLVEYPIAGPLGILTNAYVATGVAAAGLIFYRDRFQAWQASAVRRPHVIHP
jgi:hypothetical protein